MPIFLTLEAQACANAGRNEAALRAIEQALATSPENGLHWATAEVLQVLRTKARLLLSAGRTNNREIETILRSSLSIAQRQQARCWELRTSCDLSHFWQRQGRNWEALELLQSVYDQFKEGFESTDLRDARKHLEKLRRKVAKNGTRSGKRATIG
jgi:predicted ATPase